MNLTHDKKVIRSATHRWQRCHHSFTWLAVIAGLIVSVGIGMAQEVDSEVDGEDVDESLHVPLALLEREPFWELTLNAANGNKVFEILPVENVPDDPQPSDRLRIRLLNEPDQEFIVQWMHIAKLRSYDDLVFEHAERLVREKKYNEAFRHFDYLLRNQPVNAALKRGVLEYLLANADDLMQQGNYEYALALLEEVTERDAGYRAAEIATRIARAADALIEAELQREDYRQARGMIVRLEKEYGRGRIESLSRWRRKLINDATALRQQARLQMQREEYRAAERSSRQMARIWPELPGAAELRSEIARRYRMVIVGVTEVAGHRDVTAITDWAARRTGQLTEQTFVQFLGAGPEGGQYLCPFGEYYQSDDRRRLTVQLAEVGKAEHGVQVDGYDVSQRVLAMADPASPYFEPAWASLAKGTRVEDVFKLHIDLRRPHVLPEAMLQFRLDLKSDGSESMSPGEGPYLRVNSPDDEDVHFVVNPRFPFPGDEHPSEIVERYFATSEEAISALRRGDIDVMDCLFPDDAERLRRDDTLHVVRYALPTIHVLAPSRQNPFTANQTFRRALLYGINRQAILRSEVLGNSRIAGCRVISGPFPIGTRDNDPLAYAYNDRITPRAYYPRLALTLKTLAHRSLREVAKKRGEEIPTDVKLVIGHPPSEIARVACQAISQYLQIVGIECELRELAPGAGDDLKGEVDLLYMQVAMWEPVIDARRLLAPKGVAAVGNEYVGMALRRLDAAKNWREARERLHALHSVVHDQAAVIPLWQTVNHFVYRRLAGVGPSPLTLYQDVEQWQVAPRKTPQESSTAKR